MRQRKKSDLFVNKLSECTVPGGDWWICHYSCADLIGDNERELRIIYGIYLSRMDSSESPEDTMYFFSEVSEENTIQEFLSFVRSKRINKVCHWNMNDHKFGFTAIKERARWLGLYKDELDGLETYDISNAIYNIYGPEYSPHRRLPNLSKLNNMLSDDMMEGDAEPALFAELRYAELRNSTYRKMSNIRTIAFLAANSKLTVAHDWRDGKIMSYLGESRWWPLLKELNTAKSIITFFFTLFASFFLFFLTSISL